MVDALLAELGSSSRHRLADLPTCGLEPRTGIYALWYGSDLLYVGVSRQDPATTTNPQARGVPGRLNTYRLARLGNDFTLAVAFRFVVPHLSADQLGALSDGSLGVKDVAALVKTWLHGNVEFSAVLVDGAAALAAQTVARRSGLPDSGPPMMNPL
jgi:hypothetical protein